MSERRERVRSAVLGAALDLIDECGVHGLTVEAVAARSGVAKTTIYRHWPTKAALIVACLAQLHGTKPTPNTGDLRADLLTSFLALEDAFDDRTVRITASLLDAAQRDPEFARLHDELAQERQQPLRTVLELAQLRGQIRADVDLDAACDLVIGPVIARLLVSHRPVDEAFLRFCVDALVAGLQA